MLLPSPETAMHFPGLRRMSHPPDPLSPALEQVVARYAEMVRGVGRRHGLSDADVEELLQDVRVRLWRSQPASEGLASVTASYVRQAAVMAALDLIRRRRRKRESVRDLRRASQEQILPEMGGPERGVEESELAERVMRAVDRLAESRRPVVRMYLKGYTRDEIAQALGWGEGKVRNLLYRGLADLRARLAEEGIGPEMLE